MVKKITLALALLLFSASSYAAELVEIKELPAVETELVLPDVASADATLVNPEHQPGVLAWVKRHKVLTAVLVTAALGAAVAGTLYVSPTARQKAQEALAKVAHIVKHDQQVQPAETKAATAQ